MREKRIKEPLRPDVSVSYIKAMRLSIQGIKGDEEAARIISEITEQVYSELVNPHTIDLDTFRSFVLRDTTPFPLFNGILYQAFAELTRTNLGLDSETYYDAFGKNAAFADPSFKWVARTFTVPMILWLVPTFNREKNRVTDVREISTKNFDVDGQRWGSSLVERIIMPHYINDLLESFEMRDVDRILYNDFVTTRGVYEGLAREKGTTSTIEIVAKDYELTDIDIASRAFNYGIHPLKFLLRLKAKSKGPLLDNPEYRKGVYTQDLGLRVPLYIRYLVKYAKTSGTKAKKRRTYEDRVGARFANDANTVELQQQMTNAFREKAEEAEERTREAVEHADDLKGQKIKLGHNAGNIAGSIVNLVGWQRSLLERLNGLEQKTGSEINIDTTCEERRLLLRDISDVALSIDTLSVALVGVTSSLRARDDKNNDAIRKDSVEFDICQLATEYLRNFVLAENIKIRNYNVLVPDYMSDQASPEISYSVEFEHGLDYNVFLNKGFFSDAFINGIRNAIKSVKGTSHPEIKLYGKMYEEQGSTRMRLILEDNGHGAHQDVLDRINREEKIKTGEGTGTGMQTMWEFVRFYEGYLKTESPDKKGFRLTLDFVVKKEDKNKGSEGSSSDIGLGLLDV